MRVPRSRRLTRACCLAAAIALSLGFAFGRAAAEEAHDLLKGFERSGQYVLLVDGKRFEDARIYHSRLAAAYLIMDGPYEAPLLISPRTRLVQKVEISKVYERDDGLIYLLADVKLSDQGKFGFSRGQVTFTVDDMESALSPTPPLLGRKNYEDVVSHTPEFVRAGKFHKPDEAALEKLKKYEGEARVLVVFGSWCPNCKRHLPILLRVNKELSETNIEFVYHGLPKPPAAWRDQTWLSTRARKLPAVVVTSGGRVVGTMSGAEVGQPAARLANILR